MRNVTYTINTPLPESTWTKPRLDCPHPEYWTSTDNQSTELEVTELVASFVRALQPEYVLETGTCLGQTAYAIGQALARNGHGHMDSLEVDERLIDIARQRCSGLPVAIHQCSSLQFQPAHRIDFAWLDSLMRLRMAELQRFRPWLQAGAIIGIHDTGRHFGRYGDEVEQHTWVRALRLATPRGVTFLEVLSP